MFLHVHLSAFYTGISAKGLGKGSVSFCENRNGLLVPMVSFVLMIPSSKDGDI